MVDRIALTRWECWLCSLLLGFSGCTVWIDDFDIEDTDDTEISDSIVDSGTSSTEYEESLNGPDCEVEVRHDMELRFCRIPHSEFIMGCDDSVTAEDNCQPDEKPAREVTVPAFRMQQLEVTQFQYARFLEDQPGWAKGGAQALSACNFNYLSSWTNGAVPAGRFQHPVVEVCWDAARAFCAWFDSTADLPTEAQWELAAREPTDMEGRYQKYPSGDSMNCAIANFGDCEGHLRNVGISDGASPFGIHDLAGNAWEWTLDSYVADYYCDPLRTGLFTYPDCDVSFDWTAPLQASEGPNRTVRGGSWYHSPDMLRSARRVGLAVNTSSNLTGFRCILPD